MGGFPGAMAALRSGPRRLAHGRARVRPVRRAADADADVRWLTERGLFDNKGTPVQAHPKYWDTVASLVAVLDVEPVEAERILAAFTQFRTNAAGRPYALRDSWRDPLANDQPVGAAKAVVRAIGQPAATRAMRNHATLLARRADDIADTTDVLQRAGVTKSTLQRRPALLGYRADTLRRRMEDTAELLELPSSVGPRSFSLASYRGDTEKAPHRSTTNPASVLNRAVAAGALELGEGRAAARLAYLASVLTCSEDDARTILRRQPALLVASEAAIAARADFLNVEARVANLAPLVTRFPALLSYSVARSLRPKLAFAIDELGYPHGAFAEEVAQFPAFFSYSLDKRLRPRAASLARARVVLGGHNGGLKLHSWVVPTDAAFERRLAGWANTM